MKTQYTTKGNNKPSPIILTSTNPNEKKKKKPVYFLPPLLDFAFPLLGVEPEALTSSFPSSSFASFSSFNLASFASLDFNRLSSSRVILTSAAGFLWRIFMKN